MTETVTQAVENACAIFMRQHGRPLARMVLGEAFAREFAKELEGITYTHAGIKQPSCRQLLREMRRGKVYWRGARIEVAESDTVVAPR